MITTDEARTHAPEVHARWAVGTPGSVRRDPVLWQHLLDDPTDERGGGTGLFHLAHPDGYASYRMHHERNTMVVRDLFAATPEAHAALWRVLLTGDFVSHLETDHCPPGDSLAFLLTDPRLVETRGHPRPRRPDRGIRGRDPGRRLRRRPPADARRGLLTTPGSPRQTLHDQVTSPSVVARPRQGT